MASLVADYSSEDNSDSDLPHTEEDKTFEKEFVQEPPKNLLFSNNNVDSDNDNNNSSDSVSSAENSPKHCKDEMEKLPNPLLGDAQTSSVFMTSFQKAELEKKSVLEKHVQMTEKRNSSNRKICFKFRKGKCNKGKHCRFLHDQDTVRGVVNQNEFSEEINERLNRHFPSDTMQKFVEEPVDDDNYLLNSKSKKRHGVTNTLVPPKKAMLSLQDQRRKERPWTVGKQT